MSNEKSRIVTKDLEYKSHYADGIILQYTRGTAQLIFYEEELNPDNTEQDFDTEKKNIKLKFEVRIPNLALSSLASHVQQRNFLRDCALNVSELAKNDNETMNAYFKYDAKLGEFILDTQKSFPLDKFNELQELSEDLVLRANRVVTRNTQNSNPATNRPNNNQQGNATQ